MAKAVCNIPNFMYDDEKVHVALHSVKPTASFVETSKHVIFSKVPDTYEENHFTKLLKKRILKSDSTFDVETITSKPYDPVTQCVVFEFPTHDMAKAVCNIPNFMYDDEKVHVALHSVKPTASFVETSEHVIFSNVPDTYEEWSDASNASVKLSDGFSFNPNVNVNSESVDVGFQDDLIQDPDYAPDQDLLDESFDPKQDLCSTRILPQCAGEESIIELQCTPDGLPILPAGEKLRKDWPTVSSLQLLKICILKKDMLNSAATQRQGLGWRNVMLFMWERKLFYTMKTLKKSLQRMIAMYDGCEESWEYKPFVGQYLGKPPPATAASSIDELIKKYTAGSRESAPKRKSIVEENKKICGVVALTGCEAEELPKVFRKPEMSILLISEYGARKHLFDDDLHRSYSLFNEIRDIFHTKGYLGVTTEDLSKRMAYLASEYNRRADMAVLCTGSGNDFTNWMYYDALSVLFERSAKIMPQKLFAVGSSTVTKFREEENPADLPVRTGRRKGPNKSYVNRTDTKSFKQQKLELGLKLNEKLDRMVDFLEKNK